jgi:hypothetical protein
MNPITAFLVALCLAAAAAAGLWVSPYLAGVFVLAAVVIAQALQLRAMNIIYETTKERGATILLPSSMVDSLNPSAATVALALAGKGVPDPDAGVTRKPEPKPAPA